MDAWMNWLIALFVISAWMILIYILYKRGYIKEEGPISLFGPAIMLKTTKGKRAIERAGRRKIWLYYGYFCVIASFFFMAIVFALMLWQAYIVIYIPPSSAPSPVEAIGIPGINPIIPLWYGILGLIVAVVLHEFAHGLLVAYHRLKIISLGVLLFIVPIGAFVEPDEDALMKARRIKRMHVFAAGPMTNLVLATVFILLFTSAVGAIQPAHPGVYVAAVGGVNQDVFEIGDIIYEINGTHVNNIEDFSSVSAPMPGEHVDIGVYRGGERTVSAVSGVVVMSVTKGYPAEKAGIKPGWIFYSINGTVIRNNDDFLAALNLTQTGQRIEITMLDSNLTMRNFTVVLEDKYDYYEKYSPSLNRDYFRGKGFLGVSALYLGVSVGEPESIKNVLAHPYSGAKTFGDYVQRSLYMIGLPFAKLMPFPAEYENIFSTPFPGFWIIANSLYWIFWLNLMLGLTNLLPAVPLDGGYLFRDLMTALLEKMKVKDPERRAVGISRFFSFLVLFLFLWQFIGPRI